MKVTKEGEGLVVLVVDEAGTENLGLSIGKRLVAGDVVGLVGDLGAGKTTLTRAIATGAGVSPDMPVNSPTFTIVNLYDAPRLQLRHLDLYRLESEDDLAGIGLADMLSGNSAMVVEWFERFPDAFPKDLLIIKIEPVGELGRRFALLPTGEAGWELLAEVEEQLSQVPD